MRRLLLWLLAALSTGLLGCAAQSAVIALPPHPLFVIAGKHALPGSTASTVRVVDRKTLKPIGDRTLKVSYINEALYDGSALWYGYAGDIDVDMNTVAKLSPDLASETLYDVCVEPNGIHDDGTAIIVLCTVNGIVAHATRIDKATGRIVAEADIVTKWGDMMYVDSILSNGELIVYGGGDYANEANRTAQEFQIRDPKTLKLIRIVESPDTELGMSDFLVHDDAIYILNMASKSATEYGSQPIDFLRYRTGATALEPLPNTVRSPTLGTIRGNELIAVHNVGNNIDYSPVTITVTDLTTWQYHSWEFDGSVWSYINDIATIDGQIILAVPRTTDEAREGLYEFDPTTGAMTFVSAIPGASLIVDSQSPR